MKLILFYVAALAGCVWVLAWAWQQDVNRWEQFSKANGCRITEKRPSQMQIGTGISPTGSVVTIVSTSDTQVGWLCNDGIVYWRSE